MMNTCGFCGIEYEGPDGFDGSHTCKSQDLWDALGTLKETVRRQNIAIANLESKLKSQARFMDDPGDAGDFVEMEEEMDDGS